MVFFLLGHHFDGQEERKFLLTIDCSLGNLLGFDGFLNTTTPFAFDEHNVVWKTSRRYWDFEVDETFAEDDVLDLAGSQSAQLELETVELLEEVGSAHCSHSAPLPLPPLYGQLV